jgi:glycosyltransferase involved in cell wall biosynthesis
VQLRWQALGNDYFPSISGVVADEINALVPNRSVAIPWGPDLNFYHPTRKTGTGFITAGRSNRDLLTFGRAATIAGCNATIICLKENVLPEFSEFGPKVSVLAYPQEKWMPYRKLEEQISNSSVVAIPLLEQPRLSGLNSLVDAIGLGKPVIMTRTRCIDIDLEKEGIGSWVDAGNVEQWVKLLKSYEARRDALPQMGERALRFAQARFNSRLFAEEMLAIFERVLSIQTR